jgi:hypothetical protein
MSCTGKRRGNGVVISVSISWLCLFLTVAASADGGWQALFNGKDLTGWRPNLFPDSWSVVDGAIRVRATQASSHLFYVADKPEGQFISFTNFVLELSARSETNANSGIFIHTDLKTSTAAYHLANGYEVQLNSTAREKRKTGSLYAVVDLPASPVDESQWFHVRVTVNGKRITVELNDRKVVDYTEPPNVQRPPERAGRKLNPGGGAIALQGHDPGSTFFFKDIRIRPLP